MSAVLSIAAVLLSSLSYQSRAGYGQNHEPYHMLSPQGDSIGDGGPATQAVLRFPSGIALDQRRGLLYVSEQRGHRVRRVDLRSGIITTIAGRGVAGYAGDGEPARRALMNQPENLAVDAAGNLFIGDLGNHRIRRIDAESATISTVAGTGRSGFSGDGGPATAADVSNPFGLVIDREGNLVFADTENQRIRSVDSSTGVITTVAGNGTRGFSGDGGPATAASLSRPHVLTLDRAGNLIIGDSFNQRLRRVDHDTGRITTIAGTGEQGAAGDGGAPTSGQSSRR